LGLPLISSEVFDLSPLHFGVASFFIGSLWFEPMNKGYNNAPSFVALASRHNSFFIKYGASIASNFDDGDQCFREGGLYYCFGVT
jgi:hypothetical protein